MQFDDFILATSWSPDRQQFFDALRIRHHGLAAQLFGQIFDVLFVVSLDLRREYQRYYAVEYASFSDYVEIYYGKTLSDVEREKEHVFWIKYVPSLLDTAFENHQLEAVLKVISRMEIEYESED
ncbi:hypothetical protein [Henriciella pelagia]|jgi:hypothetical protein|uniref:Uncharacterized protein n=1 Tax=Henriciella pelagia TaxID=1977912 RepID=A0ABQ1JMK2_9PROT|nr:hypothetical protein [Henriciella pelagia]GGB70083.1 hypothetical protein GCM10011503_18460 [Henriciella pelagia]